MNGKSITFTTLFGCNSAYSSASWCLQGQHPQINIFLIAHQLGIVHHGVSQVSLVTSPLFLTAVYCSASWCLQGQHPQINTFLTAHQLVVVHHGVSQVSLVRSPPFLDCSLLLCIMLFPMSAVSDHHSAWLRFTLLLCSVGLNLEFWSTIYLPYPTLPFPTLFYPTLPYLVLQHNMHMTVQRSGP